MNVFHRSMLYRCTDEGVGCVKNVPLHCWKMHRFLFPFQVCQAFTVPTSDVNLIFKSVHLQAIDYDHRITFSDSANVKKGDVEYCGSNSIIKRDVLVWSLRATRAKKGLDPMEVFCEIAVKLPWHLYREAICDQHVVAACWCTHRLFQNSSEKVILFDDFPI